MTAVFPFVSTVEISLDGTRECLAQRHLRRVFRIQIEGFYAEAEEPPDFLGHVYAFALAVFCELPRPTSLLAGFGFFSSRGTAIFVARKEGILELTSLPKTTKAMVNCALRRAFLRDETHNDRTALGAKILAITRQSNDRLNDFPRAVS